MHLLKVFLSLCLVIQSLVFAAPPASALSQGVVISQVLAGVQGAATQEFVTIYNNTAQDVDITGWCLESKNVAKFACIQVEPNEKLFLPSHKHAKFASEPYAVAHPIPANSSDHYDALFAVTNQNSGNITGGSDTLKLYDGAENPVDVVSWSTALAAGNIWQRIEQQPGVLQDTDPADGMQDFVKQSIFVVAASDTYEEVTMPDVCPNLAGVQASVPEGYGNDEVGACVLDECLNMPGLQTTIPEGYKRSTETAQCELDIAPLQLTEILPNAAGSDSGQEYVEIYNPTNKLIDLSAYHIRTGVNSDKSYSFPAGSKIGPGGYVVFHDSDMKFSLVNTTGRVVLAAADGSIISETGQYDSPGDDMAWAQVEGKWQYTDQPTPGEANKPSRPEEVAEPTANEVIAAPCAPGKYRNPLTNRCRSIDADAAVLASCDTGQYRNPETGRCRKVMAAAALAPCKDGQYRSEETNRCRNFTAATALAPCAEGQERNPDTNRCRNAAAKSVPDAAFAVQPVKDGAKAFIGWWALGGIGAVALGYAGWEWRREALAFIRKISITKTFKR